MKYYLYQGLKGARYDWMMENAHDDLARMREDDTLDEYMDSVEDAYVDRVCQLMGPCLRSLGVRDRMQAQEIREGDMARWLGIEAEAKRMAQEMAWAEVVCPPAGATA